MLIRSTARTPATDNPVAREVPALLAWPAAKTHPPITLADSEAAAVGTAGPFRSPAATDQVMDSFTRNGTIDSDELIQAAQLSRAMPPPRGSPPRTASSAERAAAPPAAVLPRLPGHPSHSARTPPAGTPARGGPHRLTS